MNTGCATIITPIRGEECAKALKDFLRTEVEPQFVPDHPREILKCRPRFPFDRIESLHFCSFAVLDGDGEFPPCLVFEATFDGSRDRFLDALLRVAPGTIDEIYRHCEGYPASGRAIPELVKKHLADHDEGAHAFYLGNPGRTVAQIKGEAQIYDALSQSVSEPWSRHEAMPATFAGILQELRDVICNKPSHRWAQQAAAMPWEVAWRKTVSVAALLTVLGAPCLLGALAVDFNPRNQTWIEILIFLLLAIGVWAEPMLRFLFKDPRRQSFWPRIFLQILITAKYFSLVFVGLLFLGFDPDFERRQLSLLTGVPSPLQAILMVIGAVFVFLLFRYLATSLELAIQFKELEPAQQNRRRQLLEVLHDGMAVVAAFALMVLTRSVLFRADGQLLPAGTWQDSVVFIFLRTIRQLQDLAVSAVIGLIAAYTIGCLLFVLLRIKERFEAKRFSGAEGLATVDNTAVHAREEGGINTYQNHMVSLTYVKPGLLRAVSLRLTLFAVGLLSRFWFNDGKLGSIPTILSARWVLIDRGRRLLFLDNYSGGWNNYLNEFIDMAAVFGLNAIWTNTFIKVRGSQYAFPETEYYFWKGAQVERPFKAYVRHSQVETIVWYSAYPTVATVNVDTNTEVRQSLFMPPVSSKIDSLLQNL